MIIILVVAATEIEYVLYILKLYSCICIYSTVAMQILPLYINIKSVYMLKLEPLMGHLLDDMVLPCTTSTRIFQPSMAWRPRSYHIVAR